MYNINTKKGGHTRIRNAARNLSGKSTVLNTDQWAADQLAKYLTAEVSKTSNFLGIAKKITNSVLKKNIAKVERDAAKELGPEKAAELAANLKASTQSQQFKSGVKKVNTVGDLAILVSAIGGAVVAAPAIAGGGAVTGAGAGTAGATGATVGAGTTVGAVEAIGAGTALAGAATTLKKPSTQPLTEQVQMPTSSSIGSIVGPIAGAGLQANGKVVEGSSNSSKISQFLRDIVGPATGKDYSNVVGQVAENAALDFLATLRNKKLNGETLPAGYEALANMMLKAENKAEQKIRDNAEANIGEFVTKNWWLILLALGLLYLAARKHKTK